jgi:predicted DNA-binding protein
MREVKKHRISIRLTDEDMRMINEMSFHLDLSPSEVIRKTIENYYKIYQYCY